MESAFVSSGAWIGLSHSTHKSCGQKLNRISIMAMGVDNHAPQQSMKKLASALLVTGLLAWTNASTSAPAHALATPKLPPINMKDKDRCVPKSSAMGQANATRDKMLDLRMCDLSNTDYSGYDMAGGILENSKWDNSNLENVTMSKAYAVNASFKNVTFTNGILDRVVFDGSDLTGAIFSNAVLSDSTFENSILKDTDFTDAAVGFSLQKQMCKNPTLNGENPKTHAPTRASLGCN